MQVKKSAANLETIVLFCVLYPGCNLLTINMICS